MHGYNRTVLYIFSYYVLLTRGRESYLMFKYDDSMAEDDGDIESGKKSGVSGELGRDGKPRAADDEEDPDSPMKMVR